MKNLLIASLLALAVVGGAVADDSAAAGRQILAKNQAAVVTVRLVVSYNISYGGRDQQSESKTEAVGTVIDPGGLTVISLTTIDPSAMLKARQRSQQDIKIETEVKDVKIVLADDTELPAEIVLRDKDLDLAYLRPLEKPAKPLAALDLTKAGQPQVLDEVVCLNRLGKIANRVVTVSLERVDALVTKPRPFYVLSPGGSSGVGSPVFALTGAPLGIILIRNSANGGEVNAASMFSGNGSSNYMPIIVPAADIVDDAKQALETKK